MVCGKCKYVNREGSKVCRHCGAPLYSRTSGAQVPPAKTGNDKRKTAEGGNSGAALKFDPPHVKKSAVRSAKPSVNLQTEDRYEYKQRGQSRRFAAILILLSAVVIAGMAVIAAVIFSNGGAEVQAAASSSPTTAATSTTTPPAPDSGEVTSPEPTEDISSVFTRPSSAITR